MLYPVFSVFAEQVVAQMHRVMNTWMKLPNDFTLVAKEELAFFHYFNQHLSMKESLRYLLELFYARHFYFMNETFRRYRETPIHTLAEVEEPEVQKDLVLQFFFRQVFPYLNDYDNVQITKSSHEFNESHESHESHEFNESHEIMSCTVLENQ